MKQLPHIAGRLYGEPWSILPSAHAEICRQFRAYLQRPDLSDAEFSARIDVPRSEADDLTGPLWRDETGRTGAWHPQVEVIGSLAILPVRGMLGKHLSTLEMWCGGSDYAVIARQARNIATDDRIENVILHVDSPGGSCIGNIECARAIAEMARVKSTIAYTDKMCASAAYLLASACEEIIAAPSAIVGSISTYSAYLDESRAYEMEGLEVKMFRSGEVKGAGYPGKPWTPEEITAQQLVTDQFSTQFKSFVADRRGLAPEIMQGAYWPAEFAPAGVIDLLEDSLEALVATIRAVG
jgi:ClpP class serine protease